MLDLGRSFTTKDVAKLLASKDDSQHRQLRVSSEGKAYLSDVVGSQEISDLAFRLETWDAGNGYCGTAAALDRAFVKRIEKVLRANWPKPTSTYIDIF